MVFMLIETLTSRPLDLENNLITANFNQVSKENTFSAWIDRIIAFIFDGGFDKLAIAEKVKDFINDPANKDIICNLSESETVMLQRNIETLQKKLTSADKTDDELLSPEETQARAQINACFDLFNRGVSNFRKVSLPSPDLTNSVMSNPIASSSILLADDAATPLSILADPIASSFTAVVDSLAKIPENLIPPAASENPIHQQRFESAKANVKAFNDLFEQWEITSTEIEEFAGKYNLTLEAFYAAVAENKITHQRAAQDICGFKREKEIQTTESV